MNITPENQTVRRCLRDRKYYIDFYQREYVWDKKTVEILLNDIFYQFNLSYEQYKNSDISEEILNKYNWYYLNIYITNDVEGKEYIVDGQQRLTTLALIAVKLFHSTKNREEYKSLNETLKNCIRGTDEYSGNIYWIDPEKRKNVMDSLMKNNLSRDFQGTTEKNILERYNDISNYFEAIKDAKKLETFIYYFLNRLVLVELKISKDDTPMIFEVINDRGISLKSFEILKGKLLGSLDKIDIDQHNGFWEESIQKLKGIEDSFFIDYLKANFIFKPSSDLEKRLNNDYHRYIFEANFIADKLKFRKQDEDYREKIKAFIKSDLAYYSKLFAKIRKNEGTYLKYNNSINDLSGQYQNIIAACKLNDHHEQEKIKTIAKEIDRLYVLLNLNDAYKSISYDLNRLLKSAVSVDEYRGIFNQKIEDRIKEKLNLSNLNSLLDYDRFKMKGYDTLGRKFLRYLIARIENYICQNCDQNMQADIYHIVKKTTQARSNYQIEHILADNDENKSYFKSEEEFWQQRNRLGGLLLLLGRNNQSSGNESYKRKLKTYSNGLMLCRTLTQNCYKSNLNFTNWNKNLKVKFKPIEKFDKEALEYRSKLLYEIVKMIWEVDKEIKT